jgi:predicted nucleic acid-binding protein
MARSASPKRSRPSRPVGLSVIVVDASVVVNAVGDDRTAGAVARRALRSDSIVWAPVLLDAEVVSGLRQWWLAGVLSEERFRRAVDDLRRLPISREPIVDLMQRAFELRSNVTPYDAAYVALAEGLGCTLVTGDRRLANAPGLRCTVEVITV